MEKKLTIFYVVGGEEHHYVNLQRSLRSLKERMNIAHEIVVLEIGTKLVSNNMFRVVNEPELIDFSMNEKVGFKFWQQKYRIAEFLTTQYGLYLDTDTVLVQDVFEDIFETIGEYFGVASHFWVPTFKEYGRKAVPLRNKMTYFALKRKLGIKRSDPFFAGGAFIFKNTEKNREILNEVSTVYDAIYPRSSSYVRGITDEVFFSALLQKHDHYVDLGGAFNHSCMGDTFMPLKIDNDSVYGKNVHDAEFKKVVLFHCDVSRRDPTEKYSGRVKEIIKKLWFL
jgi:hypothetical protein